jgi:phage baseplate assembly protein V
MERRPGLGGDISDPDTADLVRRVANLLRPGTVVAVDCAKARVKVRIGKIATAWLPWITRRAGPDITWWAPEVGEQVMVLSPSGNLALGVVLGSIYQNAFPAPASSADTAVMQWKDGTTVVYDRAAHKLTVHCVGEVEITAATKVTVTAPAILLVGEVTIDGNVSVQGSVTASGSVIDAKGNTNHHVHG